MKWVRLVRCMNALGCRFSHEVVEISRLVGRVGHGNVVSFRDFRRCLWLLRFSRRGLSLELSLLLDGGISGS